MSTPFFYIGSAIACTFVLAEAAIAVPIPSFQPPSLHPDSSAPVCYIQFQGSSAIDVSPVCGKKPGETPSSNPAVTVSSATAPPVFDPKTVNASTTGQCNFVDANGNPCPRNQQESLR